jgi:hypothetical protein
MAERIVINTGPLIALARMDALDVPGQLPYEFICPNEVRAELDEGASFGYQTINAGLADRDSAEHFSFRRKRRRAR